MRKVIIKVLFAVLSVTILGLLCGGLANWHASASDRPLHVIASKSFMKQAADLPATTIFVPSRDGNFLASVYITSNVPPEETSICGALSWTDEYGNQSYPSPTLINNLTTFAQPLCFFNQQGSSPTLTTTLTPQIVPIRAQRGTRVTLQVSQVGNCGCEFQYSAYVDILGTE